MNHNESCIKVCNSLLRGELSAIQTYDQALEKFSGSSETATLERIRAEHEESAQILRNHIADMGGTPDSDSGAWGSFAQAVEATAKLLGESAALKALIEGEQHGIKEYEQALEKDEVMVEAKESIRETLLPSLFDHVATLEALRA